MEFALTQTCKPPVATVYVPPACPNISANMAFGDCESELGINAARDASKHDAVVLDEYGLHGNTVAAAGEGAASGSSLGSGQLLHP